MPAVHDGPPSAVSETRARQGRRGRHVFWILIVSTVLAALALFGTWAFHAADLARIEPNVGADTSAEARRYNTEQVPARQNAARPPGQ